LGYLDVSGVATENIHKIGTDHMQKVPWFIKIIIKLLLARFPVSNRLWRKIGIFKHGEMDNQNYAFDIFNKHYERVTFPRKDNKFVALELGPGDSLFSALVGTAHNASRTYMIDAGRFACNDTAIYHKMSLFLRDKGLSCPDIEKFDSFETFLSKCNAHYGTNGISSLKEIPDESVDFIWSEAVLEHVRKKEFFQTLCELRRILKPDGISSHRIDLQDHLGYSLNNLRFSEEFWENDVVSSSGFYTNRIRFNEMIQLFEQAGFNIHYLDKDMWPTLPIPRNKLSSQFRQLSDEELRISGFDVILTPKLK
jgi:SAM-dependent methyltransferase